MSQAVLINDWSAKQQTRYCIDLDTRDRQVEENCARVKERLKAVADHDGEIAVVCYGPSLNETWEEIRGFKYVITCSGAHKFLIDRGIIPTWHCEVDPRPHKADLIGEPHSQVEYLVASVCHKAVFDLLEGYNVKLWHVFSHEAEREGVPIAYPRGEWSITGGSNIGMRALVIGRFLGFKKFTLFGMDYSFRTDGTQHAAWHPKEANNFHAVEVSGEVYYTNPPMHQYAQSFFKEVGKLGDIELDVRGTGLLQAQIREHMKTKPLIQKQEEPAMIAATSPQVISTAYMELNRRLHEENPYYGTSGSKRAEVVRRLIESTKPATILDYGCGKGTLGKALSVPIWEYDPAIPGKEAPPRPADLVICTDVLEHIEPDYLDAVLLDLSRCTLKVCYAVVNTGPALKSLPDGRNTHLIQENIDWWKGKLAGYFNVAKVEETGPELAIILGPKSKEQQKVVAPPLDFSKRITPVRHDGTEVQFYTPNEQTHWRARSLPTKEPATIAWIDTFNVGEVLYDVGANVGTYTVWAAKRRGVKVYAFEPEAGNYALLCRNMVLNKVDGAAYCVALTDEPKVSTIYLSGQEPGGSCNSFDQEVGFDLKERKGIPQGCIGVKMDDLGLPPPAHIKIDVDGLEKNVIFGAQSVLMGGTVKSLLIEVNPSLPEHRQMLETLLLMGYDFDQSQVDAATRKEGPFKGVAEYVFRKPNTVEDYVIDKIRQAQVINAPFPHLYIEDVFPAEFYDQMVAALPTEGYKSLEEARNTKGYPERFVHDAPESVAWMRNGRLRFLLDEKFGVKSGKDELCLLRDMPGYKITPHTDSPHKSVSALFYLPRDWTDAEHGTSLYVPLIRSFKDTEGMHHDREGFRCVWTASGKPNSVFIFARTDTSFHGAEPYEGTRTRDILLYDSRRK